VGAGEGGIAGDVDGDEVGRLPRLEGADVVPAEDGRPSPGRGSEGLAGGELGTAIPDPRGHRHPGGEEGLAGLGEEVGGVVRRRPVDPEADGDPGVEVAAEGGEAGGEPHVRRRAVGDAGPGLPEPGHLGGGDVDGVGEPHVAAEPADGGGELDGTHPEPLPAEALLVGGLGEVGVEAHPEPPGEEGGLGHEPRGDGERGAGGEDDPGHRPRGGVVEGGDDPLAVGEDGLLVLDDRVGRESPRRLAEAHRAAGDVEADPDPGRGRHLVVDPGPVGPQVLVVEGGRAPAEGELGEPEGRGDADVPGAEPRPHGVEGAEPREEGDILRSRERPGEGLVEVVVGVDEPGEDDHPPGVEHLVGGVGKLRRRTHPLDPPVAGEETAPGDLGAGVVHRHDDLRVVDEEGRHRRVRGGDATAAGYAVGSGGPAG